MFALIATFRVRSAAITNVVRAFKQEVLPLAEEQPGFLKADLFTRSRLDKGVAVLFWDTEQDARLFARGIGVQALLAPLEPFLVEPPVAEGYEPNVVGSFPAGTHP